MGQATTYNWAGAQETGLYTIEVIQNPGEASEQHDAITLSVVDPPAVKIISPELGDMDRDTSVSISWENPGNITDITVRIVNEDEEGVFLRAAAAGWGSEGSNGGHVTMTAEQQTIDGDMIVDEISSLNLYLKESSSFNGAINSDGESGDVYVEIEDGSTWTLTGDSYITSLTCGAGSINLNGHKLYVNGQEYTEGSASEGEAIAVETSSENSHGKGGRGDGNTPPEKPSGDSSGHGDGNTPPEKPSGDGNGSGGESTPQPSGDSKANETSGQ